ncbi:hypothetical protein VNO80_18270 [Phaseolus coccineus]|uniref:AB hydrolase-1 domain-containing protein n=1 Tax=Phaseolus coccineus TaxID=3886 RepID=A0AAN9MDU7_PHACN
MVQKEALQEAHTKLRSDFYKVLRRYREEERVTSDQDPKHEASAESFCKHSSNQGRGIVNVEICKTEVMESCPKADIENLEELLEEEEIWLYIPPAEDNGLEQEAPEVDVDKLIDLGSQPERHIRWKVNRRVPLLILKLKESDKQRRRPAVVFLHGLDKNKESLRPWLKAYASRGYIAISMDAAHHGERAKSINAIRNALVAAWTLDGMMPFIYDTAYDLIKLADYLTAKREDIDPSRIGITGISLGGMHAWFGAFADTRYAVVVPLVGVQGFRWMIDNEKWMDQYDSLKHFLDVARHNLSKDVIDKEVVEKAFDRVAPGLASKFDSPNSIPAIAPRPLLIINGAEDPYCPIASLEVPRSKAMEAYEAFQCLDHFKCITESGVGHELTKFQVKESADWFDRFLNP